jgi:hypothetical protein
MEIMSVCKKYLGWCPNAPAIRTAPAVLVVSPEMIHPARPGDGRSAGSSGRIRRGVSIAAGSLKAMLRDRRLLWFVTLAGFVMLFLIAVEEYTVAHIQSSIPFLLAIPVGDFFLIYPYIIFDTQLFLIETICLSLFTILLAGLILYRTGNCAYKPITIREAFASIGTYAGSLAVLSVTMALFGTLLYAIISQSQFFGKVIMTIDMAVFYLPYAYYFPGPLSSAIFFSVIIMVINIVLFLIALYVIPVIVLEKKGLVPALAGSVTLMMRTWREILGCVIVFGAIILGVFTVALVIGQSPLLLNHDYDFFLQVSRGQLLMMTVCSLFIIACWALLAAGFTATGIAIADLYSCGADAAVKEPGAGSTTATEPAS